MPGSPLGRLGLGDGGERGPGRCVAEQQAAELVEHALHGGGGDGIEVVLHAVRGAVPACMQAWWAHDARLSPSHSDMPSEPCSASS